MTERNRKKKETKGKRRKSEPFIELREFGQRKKPKVELVLPGWRVVEVAKSKQRREKSDEDLSDEAFIRRHAAAELEEVELIGINNRDLETFQVDLYNTERVLDEDTKRRLRERDIICVGESGIFTPEDVKVVQDAGGRSVLVGESLVKEEDIEGAVKKLLS